MKNCIQLKYQWQLNDILLFLYFSCTVYKTGQEVGSWRGGGRIYTVLI
jgi:hypothetical protein